MDNRENLETHTAFEHNHVCQKCDSVFDSKVLLASHDGKEHSFKCSYCTMLLGSEVVVQQPKCWVCEDEFMWVESRYLIIKS